MLQTLQSPQSQSGVTAWECVVGSSCLLHFRALRVEQPPLLLVCCPCSPGPPSCLHHSTDWGWKGGQEGIIHLERGFLGGILQEFWRQTGH